MGNIHFGGINSISHQNDIEATNFHPLAKSKFGVVRSHRVIGAAKSYFPPKVIFLASPVTSSAYIGAMVSKLHARSAPLK